ncbi:tetratricopeptide repeat protein [Ferrimonas balearica]|uniref:tetratricopeptide repeat protein n=1 Tax=Ferrimonas balearica TaxID=44012 RepID=UPI001C55EF2B|nr:tetratricopeptide repeat protein [Ferrimonas balearica]MBW3164158.1 hypothetical protein [Ferrimonas balearica]MBY6224133.1 hypothetical protein [Ferrimonas balearica]
MQRNSKLLPALLLSIAAGVIATPAPALAAEKCAVDTRKTRVVSERVGKRIQKAYELYSADQVDQALELLLEISTSNEFDKAYVSRFIGNLYAGKDGQAQTAMKHLKVAIDIDQLGGTDHAAALRLMADLSIQERKFEQSLKYYEQWMAFTCKEDTNVYLRMATANFELKRHDKVLPLADKAIATQTSPNKGPYTLKMGSYYETKQYSKAAKVVEDMVRLFPSDQRLWVQLAQMYMLSEDYKRSLYTMDVAYRNGYLEKPSEYKMLAQLYAQNEIPFRSAQIQEEYLSSGVVEKDEASLSMLANTYHQAKEIGKAITYYGQVAEMTDKSRYYMRQAGLLMEAERFKEAKTAARKALDAQGLKSAGEAQMLLAQAHFYLEEYAPAYRAAQAAVKDSKTAKTAQGWVSYIQETAQRKKVQL